MSTKPAICGIKAIPATRAMRADAVAVEPKRSGDSRQDERQNVGTLRLEIRLLASAVAPKVPPYHALIRIPN